jgi:signal transduction histidine kinase
MLSSIRIQHDRLVSTYPRDSGAMEAARTLTSIEQGLERLSDILRQTRLIVEDPQALHRSFSTRDLIEKVRSRWPARSFSFKDAIEVRPDALNLGRIDSSELFVLNALANLAENADRYKKNRIAVVVEPDFGTGELVFRFENDAEPLPPSVFVLSHGREKIFDLGYTTRGTGVGTALVWHTARILGHRVRFRNSKEGVVFEYRIPVFSQDRLLPAPLRYLPNRAPVRTHPAERAA